MNSEEWWQNLTFHNENRINSVRVDVSKVKDEWRKDLVTRCANYALRILQSNQFKTMILNMDRDYWLKGETKGSPFLSMNNQETYEALMMAKEEWNNDVDREIDLDIATYRKPWSRVKGYMVPGKPTVFVNLKYFDKNAQGNEKKIVSNFIHEWCHTMGSRHSGKYIRQSLPYYMNHITNLIYSDVILEKTMPRYYTVCERKWYTLWLIKTCYRRVL